MRRLMTGAVLAVVVAGVAMGTSLLASGQKGGGATTSKQVVTKYPVTVTFANRNTVDVTDMVTSDAKSQTYTDGVDGVAAYFEVGTTTSGGTTTYDYGKLIVSIGTVRGKIVRTLNLNYSDPVSTGCTSSLGGAPSGTTTTTWFQVLGRIALLPTGEYSAGTTGFLNNTVVDPAGTFAWHGGDVLPNYPTRCSNLISIYRTDAYHWTVTTDSIPGQTYVYHRGGGSSNLLFTASDVGPTAQFENTSTNPFYGNYKMPFSMTVTCKSFANCPPAGK